MEKFFKLKENGTTVGTEVLAGMTTFFAMAYILFVNPATLNAAGIPFNAAFVATVFATVIATLVMGLFANVPYALAPGMGLNSFFAYTVVLLLGYTWQEALGMVMICGLINILITVTSIRKQIIAAIPRSLQLAISGGIGIFVAYLGFINGGLINPAGAVPAMTDFRTITPVLAMIGVIVTIVLMIKKVKGAILLGIVITTVIAMLSGSVDFASAKVNSFDAVFSDFGSVFGQAFSGIGSLLSNPSRYLEIFMTVFAFSLSDTFDTIGTFIGTGRASGIFTDKDIQKMGETKGFETKMDKALFADAIGTSIGAVLGTSNTTTYVESSAGIEAGGRTGLTAVTVAVLFLASLLFAPFATLIPSAATAPALIIVGILMVGSFKEIDWTDFEVAVPAFFGAVFMGLSYSISNGIAAGFFFYILVKIATNKLKEIHPIVWFSTCLFLINFIYTAVKYWGVV